VRKAGIAELKAGLSEYLAAVKAGAEVVVTERGRPIAKIVPIRASVAASARLEQLIREGSIRAPEKDFDRSFWRLPRPADPAASVRAALLSERDEGR
jgi:prevent-host-death family protein